MNEIQQPRNQKPHLVTAIPGPKSAALRAQEDAILAPGLQSFALMAGIVVKEARGNTVTDEDGNVFLDIIGGIGVNGLGHSHPRLVRAVQEQVAQAAVGSFTSRARLRLLEKIKEHRLAPELYRAQFYSSGSEAVESALRLAKCRTGKWEFMSFWGGFHGKTLGTLALMGSGFKNAYGPMAPGSHILPYADCYRCPFTMEYPGCGLLCAEFARRQIKMSCSRGLAAILVEPMQGTAGNVIPPDAFLGAIREIAGELGALVIADEMITGFGRTGTFWGCEHSGLIPDILTIGKQFGGGYPISGVVSTAEIVQSKPWSDPSGSSSSYGGNPLAMAAAAAAIGIIDDEGLVENSREVGAYFLERLKPLEERYPFVGAVRGRGLFIGVELVEDKKSKTPLAKTKCRFLFDECLKRGLLSMCYAPSFRIQPSMTIDRGTVDEVVAILDSVFSLFHATRA